MIQSTYLHDVLDIKQRSKIISKVVNNLKRLKSEYAIACCGMSGMLIAPEVAGRLNKPLWIVRKKENSHAYYKVEGKRLQVNYIIIDDQIASGNTIRYIIKNINHSMKCAKKLKKIILYASDGHDYDKKEFNCLIQEL